MGKKYLKERNLKRKNAYYIRVISSVFFRDGDYSLFLPRQTKASDDTALFESAWLDRNRWIYYIFENNIFISVISNDIIGKIYKSFPTSDQISKWICPLLV